MCPFTARVSLVLVGSMQSNTEDGLTKVAVTY